MTIENDPLDESPEDVKPKRATRREVEEDEGYDRSPLKTGGLSGIKSGGVMQTFIVSLIAAFVVFLGMGMFGGGSFLTKADFEANLAGMVASVDEAKVSADAAVQGIPTAITTAVTNATSQWSTRINTNLTDISNLKATVASHTTSIANSILKTDLAAYGKKADLDAAIARIKVLEDKLVTGTTSTGDGTGAVSQGVTVSVDFAPTGQVFVAGNYTYYLTISNTSGMLKKVYLQATATSSGGISGAYTVNTGTTKFTSTTGYFTPATFTTTFSPYTPPTSVNCHVINGISNGYILMGTTTIQIPITFTLDYTTTGVTMWNVTFVPIVTSP